MKKRPIVEEGNCILISLPHSKFAKIDKKNINKVKNTNWFLEKSSNGKFCYVVTCFRDKDTNRLSFIYLHRLLFGNDFHSFRTANTLDCRKSNIVSKGNLNEIIIKGDHALIRLNKDKFCLIDKEDVIKTKRYKIYYVKRHNRAIYGNKSIDASHLILDTNKIIDHINGDGLDNRKENLRICTHIQNSYNAKKRKNNPLKYKGIFKSSKNRFSARIRSNRKSYYLGTFNTQEEAAKAYNKAAIKYHGDFAKLNKIE